MPFNAVTSPSIWAVGTSETSADIFFGNITNIDEMKDMEGFMFVAFEVSSPDTELATMNPLSQPLARTQDEQQTFSGELSGINSISYSIENLKDGKNYMFILQPCLVREGGVYPGPLKSPLKSTISYPIIGSNDNKVNKKIGPEGLFNGYIDTRAFRVCTWNAAGQSCSFKF